GWHIHERLRAGRDFLGGIPLEEAAAPDWPRLVRIAVRGPEPNVRIWSLEGRGLIWRKQSTRSEAGRTLFGPRRPKRQLSGDPSPLGLTPPQHPLWCSQGTGGPPGEAQYWRPAPITSNCPAHEHGRQTNGPGSGVGEPGPVKVIARTW